MGRIHDVTIRYVERTPENGLPGWWVHCTCGFEDVVEGELALATALGSQHLDDNTRRTVSIHEET